MPGDRLSESFASRHPATGLIPYFTAGYPSLDVTLELLHAAESRAAAVELGIPFSDPIADGPDIQRASEWALRRGVGVDDVLALVARYRAGGGQRPLIAMTYANPILKFGIDRFARAAREAGLDGVLVSDLPPDESPDVWSALDRAALATVTLVAPTTAPERLPLVVGRARGFVYCLARTGVTGAGGGEAGAIDERLRDVRRLTSLPVAVGFGIASGDQARPWRGRVDAVVVGAALMREVARDLERDVVARVGARLGELADALEA